MKTLPISSSLFLPLDAVTQKLAFLGRTGSGKSYAAMKLCETMMAAGAQVVVFDPVGVWFGLRLDAGGKKPSRFTLPVFGGDHGDLPLTAQSGRIIARLVVERRLSAVLDVSMLRKNERKQFATDFAEELFHAKKSARSPVHLFVEEAQTFVPQKTFKGEERMLGAFEDLIKLGRNYGIGASLISQRPQAVNKDALNQTECLFAFQMTGPQERKAIEDWVSEKGMAKTIADDLPKLQTGRPHVWSPQWLKVSEVIGIASKDTFDASATPDHRRAITVGELSPIDIEALKSEMAEVITQAETDNPAALRRRITALERELAQAKKSREVEKVEVPVITAEDWERLDGLWREQDALGQQIKDALSLIAQRYAGLLAKPPEPEMSRPYLRVQFPEMKPVSKPVRKPESKPRLTSAISLREGERRMLQVLAQFPNLGSLTRDQLALLSGYTRSGTFDTYVGTLTRHDLAEKIEGGRLCITQAGLEFIGDEALAPPKTTAELIAMFSGRLREGERRMLAELVDAYPDPITRDELARRTGYTRSGTFDTYVGTLTRNLLIVKEGGGVLRANEWLFFGGRK
jgi:hypothetical protein